MNKEEVINEIIERYKGFENKGRINIFNCCPEIDCDYCQFDEKNCTNGIAMSLLDRLVKVEEQSNSLEKTCYKLQQTLEEKKETNLEHYFNVGDVIVYGAQQYIYLNDNCWYAYDKSESSHIVDWLLSPYEEPKPKYKLSQFEYDLLKYFGDSKYGIRDFWILEHMQSKGYFKDIPKDTPVKDVLANCEVVEE